MRCICSHPKKVADREKGRPRKAKGVSEHTKFDIVKRGKRV